MPRCKRRWKRAVRAGPGARAVQIDQLPVQCNQYAAAGDDYCFFCRKVLVGLITDVESRARTKEKSHPKHRTPAEEFDALIREWA